jgi:CCR4-NOT transcription complex subunit 6
MSYNILNDYYVNRQMFGWCPNWALTWDYRRKAIMDEIKNYSADIICLQEVETEKFYNFFLPELTREGYEGIFAPKSRAKTMNDNDRKHVDGSAIFFRKRKFTMVKKHVVEFNQMAMSNADGCDDMLNRVMTKDNISLVALLQTKEGAFDESNCPPDSSQMNQPILVCNAHLHWDPEVSVHACSSTLLSLTIADYSVTVL